MGTGRRGAGCGNGQDPSCPCDREMRGGRPKGQASQRERPRRQQLLRGPMHEEECTCLKARESR